MTAQSEGLCKDMEEMIAEKEKREEWMRKTAAWKADEDGQSTASGTAWTASSESEATDKEDAKLRERMDAMNLGVAAKVEDAAAPGAK